MGVLIYKWDPPFINDTTSLSFGTYGAPYYTYLWYHHPGHGSIKSEPLPGNAQNVSHDGRRRRTTLAALSDDGFFDEPQSSSSTASFTVPVPAPPPEIVSASKASTAPSSADTLDDSELKLFLTGQRNSNTERKTRSDLNVWQTGAGASVKQGRSNMSRLLS